MNIKNFMEAMKAIESDRKLTKEIVVEALQEALSKAFRKHIEIPDALVRVAVDENSGDIRVYQQRLIVELVEDDELEISLEDAKRVNQNFELGELVEEEVDFSSFGRAAVILAKNVVKQKIREAEKLAVYEEYCDKVEEMIFGTIESVEEKFCVVNIGKTLAIMPKNQQIPNETYKEGSIIRVVITEVNKETKGAQVLVSRADAILVKRLFEKEVPEIFQGIIEIKAIARDAGERTKMAVYSHNENIDPIGACIGPRGQRVQEIIDELKGEKIDIFEWSEDITQLIKNALSPAEVLAVIPNEERKGGLYVIVPDHQLSLAIGKKGKNARLAVKLTGHKIDIKKECDMDAMGIDWKAIALRQQEEFLARQEEAKAVAQQERFDEQVNEEVVSLDDAGVSFAQEVEEEEFIPSEKAETVLENVEVENTATEEVYESELEKAARIAKEKHKNEGLNVKDKQEYVSKFEDLADASSARSEQKNAKPKFKKTEERRATFNLKDIDYGMKPIYSAEELEEIERKQIEEEENDWIHDDEIDYDEYDKYYDED